MSELLPCVEIEPAGEASCSVLWLHGLGADGHDFEPIVPHLGISPELGVRFVFPHAPSIPVTLNGGFVMPAWFDIPSLTPGGPVDEEGIRRAGDQLTALIRRENERGIPSERIVLAGFSQGGAVALHVGLRHPERVAGILALSTFLLLEDTLADERAPANEKTPILQMHGTLDPMVVPARGEHARDALGEWGYAVEWQAYPMAHQVCMEQIQDIGVWMNRVLAVEGAAS